MYKAEKNKNSKKEMVSEVKVLVTRQEAKDMRDEIRLLEEFESQQLQNKLNADMAIALAWFNNLGINIQTAQTRDQALANFNQIETMLQSETNNLRLKVLRNKLKEADEKYKERKRNG